MSELTDSLDDALQDAFNAVGQSFTWKGVSYACVLNGDAATLVTSKSLFNGALPRPGDTITVAGKDRQVIAIDNATQLLAPGGYIEPGSPYIDDPSNPALAIQYGAFIRG